MSRPALASAALLTAVLLVGCGGEEPAVETRAAAERPAPSAEPTAPATPGPAGDGVLLDAPDAPDAGFHPDDNRFAVYFDSVARAQEFVLVHDRQDVGSAEVTTYCLD